MLYVQKKNLFAAVHTPISFERTAPARKGMVYHHATGTFGSLNLSESWHDGFSLHQLACTPREDFQFYVKVPDAPRVAMTFILKNDLRYSIDGFADGLAMRHQYNLVYLPAGTECHYTFKARKDYMVFTVLLSVEFLEQWKILQRFDAFATGIRANLPVQLSAAHAFATADMLAVVNEIFNTSHEGLVKMYRQTRLLDLLRMASEHILLSSSRKLGKPVSVRERDMEKIQEVKQYVEQNLAEIHSIEDVANGVGLRVFRLKSVFRRAYGSTLFDYITEERMKKAMDLLIDPETSVRHVSAKVGYRNQANFTVAFRRHFGYPPSATRPGFAYRSSPDHGAVSRQQEADPVSHRNRAHIRRATP